MGSTHSIWHEDPERRHLMESFFNELNEFMSARHGYKRHKCQPWINKVDARCSKFALTLGFRHDNSVGISAIRFKDQRCGHCTALVEFLDLQSIVYRIPYIEFVSVLSDSMRNFIHKNKFINRDGGYSPLEDREVLSQDWYRKTPFALQNNG